MSTETTTELQHHGLGGLVAAVEHKIAHPLEHDEKTPAPAPAAATATIEPEIPAVTALVETEKPVSTAAVVAAAPKESFIQTIEADAKKVWSVIEIVGKDADKGLSFASQYLPEVASLAAVFFPQEQAVFTGVVNAVSLIQKAVVDIKQKSALLPAGLTETQMVAEELALVGPEVTQLLADEGISADNAFITKIINGVVAILDARQVATAA